MAWAIVKNPEGCNLHFNINAGSLGLIPKLFLLRLVKICILLMLLEFITTEF